MKKFEDNKDTKIIRMVIIIVGLFFVCSYLINFLSVYINNPDSSSLESAATFAEALEEVIAISMPFIGAYIFMKAAVNIYIKVFHLGQESDNPEAAANNKKNYLIFRVVVCAIILFLSYISISNYNSAMYDIKIRPEQAKKEENDILKVKKPYNYSIDESPIDIDILWYKNKETEYNNIIEKEMPENVSKYYDSLLFVQDITGNYYSKYIDYSETSSINGTELKTVLEDAITSNKKIDEIIGGNAGIYIRASISGTNVNTEDFQYNGSNAPDKINSLINQIKDSSKYYLRVIKKYGLFGITNIELIIYDDNKSNEEYIIDILKSNEKKFEKITDLDRRVLDVLATSNVTVSGAVVKKYIEDIITIDSKYNSFITVDIIDNNGVINGAEKTYLSKYKNEVSDNSKYQISKLSSEGVNTKSGYMYTYHVEIKSLE